MHTICRVSQIHYQTANDMTILYTAWSLHDLAVHHISRIVNFHIY